MECIDEIKTLLFSEKRLNRDQGESKLNALQKSNNSLNVVEFVNHLIKHLQDGDPDTTWPVIHGSLLGIKCILLKYSFEDCKVFGDSLELIRNVAITCLSHDEVRVRLVAGDVMGVLCKLSRGEVYPCTKNILINLLNNDLERHGQEDAEEHQSFTSKDIFHQSAGWRHLETSMKCLQTMIQNCGDNFADQLDKDLLSLMFRALDHENRFVRETGYNVFAEIFASKIRLSQNPVVSQISSEIAAYIAKGLADNWSQVRLASSRVARNFLVNYEKSEEHFDRILPRICLNRYYIADGVRIYSQRSWQEICGDQGIKFVENHIEAVVKYYIQATQANNHAVREAACHCIAELAIKINSDKTRPFVPSLINALLDCFKDDSWPVRDAACVSCGNLLLEFYDEVRSHENVLYKLFLGNLQDPIPSVRAGAAITLGKYAKAYPEKLQVVVKEIEDGFDFIKTQPEDSENFIGLDKKPAVFGVVKNLHDPNHTDQIMYSCGSLAPKMGRGKLGGCTDCHFQRPSRPWERSDGCVYFLTELARYHPESAVSLIPSLIKASTFKHFPQHVVFIETICKQLPAFARVIKKRPFKNNLEKFFDLIFYAVDSDVQLTAAAGEQCLVELSKFIGRGILRGRIEMWNPNRVSKYDEIVR